MFSHFYFFRACVDIAHFVGLPSAAFCVFKKLSGCSVGLIEDPEILNTVLSGIRGGMRYFFFLTLPTRNKCVHFFHFWKKYLMCKKLFDFFSFVSTRILKACPKHDKDVHGIYCDANNLYGHWSVHLHRKIGKCILNLCRQIQICNVFNCNRLS